MSHSTAAPLRLDGIAAIRYGSILYVRHTVVRKLEDPSMRRFMAMTVLLIGGLMWGCGPKGAGDANPGAATTVASSAGAADVKPLPPGELCRRTMALVKGPPPPQEELTKCTELYAKIEAKEPDRYPCVSRC